MISDEARRFRQLLDEVVEELVAVGIGHGVQVVEHDDELLPEGRDRVRQLVDRRFERVPGDLESLQRAAAETAADAIDGRRHVAPHPVRIVVAPVERHPGRRELRGSHTMRAPRSSCRIRAVPRRVSGRRPRFRRACARVGAAGPAPRARAARRAWPPPVEGAGRQGVRCSGFSLGSASRSCPNVCATAHPSSTVRRPVPTPSAPPSLRQRGTGGGRHPARVSRRSSGALARADRADSLSRRRRLRGQT